MNGWAEVVARPMCIVCPYHRTKEGKGLGVCTQISIEEADWISVLGRSPA